jgi:hypothetical protein
MLTPRWAYARAREDLLMSRELYLGSYVLPSGNSCDVWLARDLRPGTLRYGGLRCEWDRPPSPSWPRGDIEHWRAVTWPAIVRAIATATGQRVLGVTA